MDKNKRTDQPIVYKDGSMEQYASEEFGVISSRLENILKERERK